MWCSTSKRTYDVWVLCVEVKCLNFVIRMVVGFVRYGWKHSENNNENDKENIKNFPSFFNHKIFKFFKCLDQFSWVNAQIHQMQSSKTDVFTCKVPPPLDVLHICTNPSIYPPQPASNFLRKYLLRNVTNLCTCSEFWCLSYSLTLWACALHVLKFQHECIVLSHFFQGWLVIVGMWSEQTNKVAWLATVSCSDLLENDIKCVYWQDNPTCQVSIFSKKPFLSNGILCNPKSPLTYCV